MALVRKIDHQPNAGGRYSTEVDCGYSVLEIDGRTVLHLESYGSSKRQIPGKVSQSLEFDVDGATQLLDAVYRAFPSLRDSD